MTAAKKHLPKQTSTNQHKTLYSHSNSAIYRHIKLLHKYYYKLKKATSLPNSNNHEFPLSYSEHQNLMKTALHYSISTASIDTHYDNGHIVPYMAELKFDIIKPIQAKQKIISRSENNERILKFLKQRNDNFKDAPTKMIDSCLERNRKAVVIDRLLINKDSNDQYLELSPENIKKHTADHFQNIAGSYNCDVTDPTSLDFKNTWNNWKSFYDPVTNIDNNIYSHILDIPSVDEWSAIIKSLPNHKATGPSQISNEMLKNWALK
jgi:hypothetical protein